MPIYEYDCAACGGAFEALIRSGEPPVCPACGSRKLEKRFSVFGVVSGQDAPACPPGPVG